VVQRCSLWHGTIYILEPWTASNAAEGKLLFFWHYKALVDRIVPLTDFLCIRSSTWWLRYHKDIVVLMYYRISLCNDKAWRIILAYHSCMGYCYRFSCNLSMHTRSKAWSPHWGNVYRLKQRLIGNGVRISLQIYYPCIAASWSGSWMECVFSELPYSCFLSGSL